MGGGAWTKLVDGERGMDNFTPGRRGQLERERRRPAGQQGGKDPGYLVTKQ